MLVTRGVGCPLVARLTLGCAMVASACSTGGSESPPLGSGGTQPGTGGSAGAGAGEASAVGGGAGVMMSAGGSGGVAMAGKPSTAGSGGRGGAAGANVGAGTAGSSAGLSSTGGRNGSGAGTGGGTNAGGAVNSTGCGNATLPAACDTTTTGPCTLDVDGTEREYFVVLPADYDPSTPHPLIFVWHGLTGTAQQLIGGGFLAYYGVRAKIPNAIYVSAQGLPSTADGTDYGWPNTNGQDVKFTRAMLDGLESNYCVDTNRVFSTGMSYGGIMSITLGCQMPDVFHAIGVMSGSMFGNANSCLKNPIPAWFTHGDADTTLDISGDVTARDALLARNGCDTTSTQTVAMSDGITTCTLYTACTAGNYPVVWCPVPGEEHTIPSWAGAEIAKFFLQF